MKSCLYNFTHYAVTQHTVALTQLYTQLTAIMLYYNFGHLARWRGIRQHIFKTKQRVVWSCVWATCTVHCTCVCASELCEVALCVLRSCIRANVCCVKILYHLGMLKDKVTACMQVFFKVLLSLCKWAIRTA